MNKFEAIKAEAEALKAQIEQLRATFAEKVKPLFQQFVIDNPQVAAVTWRQYTPYFNDGDACVFNVYDRYFRFVNDALEDDDDENGYSSYHLGADRGRWSPPLEVCSLETGAACRAFDEFIASIEDYLEQLFGDHVRVTITKDGVEVEEYYHD